MGRMLVISGILLAGIYYLFFLSTASACTPGDPDFWYTEIITIDAVDLPTGIIIGSEDVDLKYSARLIPSVALQNQSSTEIRLLTSTVQSGGKVRLSPSPKRRYS